MGQCCLQHTFLAKEIKQNYAIFLLKKNIGKQFTKREYEEIAALAGAIFYKMESRSSKYLNNTRLNIPNLGSKKADVVVKFLGQSYDVHIEDLNDKCKVRSTRRIFFETTFSELMTNCNRF